MFPQFWVLLLMAITQGTSTSTQLLIFTSLSGMVTLIKILLTVSVDPCILLDAAL